MAEKWVWKFAKGSWYMLSDLHKKRVFFILLLSDLKQQLIRGRFFSSFKQKCIDFFFFGRIFIGKAIPKWATVAIIVNAAVAFIKKFFPGDGTAGWQLPKFRSEKSRHMIKGKMALSSKRAKLPVIFALRVVTQLADLVRFQVDDQYHIVAFVLPTNVEAFAIICKLVGEIPATGTRHNFANVSRTD